MTSARCIGVRWVGFYNVFLPSYNIMPKGFTSESAKRAGAKSKRGPNKASPKFIEFMKGEGSDLAMEYLIELKGAEYIENYVKLAPYALAKLQSIAVQSDSTVRITLIHPDDDLLESI